MPGVDLRSLRGVSLDSRRIEPGWLFAALPGATVHGAQFAAQAVAAGATAILTDAAGAAMIADTDVPLIVVDDPRRELATVAAEVYGRPADALALYGVTGTAGKTSTVAFLTDGLMAAGHHVGTIGTLGVSLDNAQLPLTGSTVTTPEASDLHAWLTALVQRGATAVAMEVSSHALALHRVDGITFAVAGFTNLGHDHLDFHPSQEAYFRAKASLFRDRHSQRAVVNIDGTWGERLAAELQAEGREVLTIALDKPADYRVVRWDTDADGRTSINLKTPSGPIGFTIALMGRFSILNASLAAAMLAVGGCDLDRALVGFAATAVPGRMERVDLGADAPRVIVDFAHTPEEVDAAVSALPAGRRVIVVGAGGDRDPAKREPMGEAAARAADVVVVTDDNPRSENPASIRARVLAGARRAGTAEVHDGGDRRSAIRLALTLAGAEGWVAILGKGAEHVQHLPTGAVPFDDATVVRQEWLHLSSGSTAQEDLFAQAHPGSVE